MVGHGPRGATGVAAGREAVTVVASVNKTEKVRTRSARIQARARELHRCPDGYSGPCWGPTYEDVHRATEMVNSEIVKEHG